MKNPKYSVIIPVYNKEEYLEECVISVIYQSVKDLEILLINDGSKDNSLEICNRLAKKDNRIIVIDKQNSGVSDTRNLGIDRANGDYILFLDADDFWSSDLLRKVDKNIGNNDLLMFRSCRDDRLLKSEINENVQEISNRIGILKSVIYNQNLLNNCDANFNRVTDYAVSSKVLRESKVRFNKELKIGEDKLFNFELMQKIDKISYLNQYLYYIRTNRKSVMGSYNQNAFEMNKKLFNSFLDAIDKIENRELKQDLKLLSDCLGYQIVWNSITSDFCHKDNPNSYKSRKLSYNLSKSYLKNNCLNSLKEYDRYLFKVFKYPFFMMNVIMKNRLIRGVWFYCNKLTINRR